MSPAEVSVGRFRLQLGRVMSLASGRAIVGVVTSFLETPQTAVSKKARTAILGLAIVSKIGLCSGRDYENRAT